MLNELRIERTKQGKTIPEMDFIVDSMRREFEKEQNALNAKGSNVTQICHSLLCYILLRCNGYIYADMCI